MRDWSRRTLIAAGGLALAPSGVRAARAGPLAKTTHGPVVFDAETRLVDDPRGAERRLFAKVPYIQPGT